MQISSYFKLIFRATIFFRVNRGHSVLHKIHIKQCLESIVTISDIAGDTSDQLQLIIGGGSVSLPATPVLLFPDRKGGGDLIPESMVFARAGDEDEGINLPWISFLLREAAP